MKSVIVHKNEGFRGEDYSVVVSGVELAQSITEVDLEVDLVYQGKRVARARVGGAWGGPMNLVPAMLLERHHDPVCRSFSGLALVRSVIDNKAALGDDLVSVLFLKPLPDSKIVLPEFKLTGRRGNAP